VHLRLELAVTALELARIQRVARRKAEQLDVDMVDGEGRLVGEGGEGAGRSHREAHRPSVRERDVGTHVVAAQCGGDLALGGGAGGHLGADAGLDPRAHPELGEGPLLIRGDAPDADRWTAHRGSSIVGLDVLTTAPAPPTAAAPRKATESGL